MHVLQAGAFAPAKRVPQMTTRLLCMNLTAVQPSAINSVVSNGYIVSVTCNCVDSTEHWMYAVHKCAHGGRLANIMALLCRIHIKTVENGRLEHGIFTISGPNDVATKFETSQISVSNL